MIVYNRGTSGGWGLRARSWRIAHSGTSPFSCGNFSVSTVMRLVCLICPGDNTPQFIIFREGISVVFKYTCHWRRIQTRSSNISLSLTNNQLHVSAIYSHLQAEIQKHHHHHIALWPWGRLILQQKLVPGAFPGGKGGQCIRLTTLPPSCAVFMKSGNFTFLEPSGPLQGCNGTAFFHAIKNVFKRLDFGFSQWFYTTHLLAWTESKHFRMSLCDQPVWVRSLNRYTQIFMKHWK